MALLFLILWSIFCKFLCATMSILVPFNLLRYADDCTKVVLAHQFLCITIQWRTHHCTYSTSRGLMGSFIDFSSDLA